MQNIRTDLAAEAQRLWRRGNTALEGVVVRDETLHGLPVLAVQIENSAGAEALGKACGQYYALTLPAHPTRGSAGFPDAVEALAELLRRCMPREPASVLVAALGNPDITPDALGSLAAGNILVTRHLKEQSPEDFRAFSSLALCRPGVLGTTGLESAAQVAMLCRELHPALVIAIDALAGCEAEGLCRTVQVSDAGVAPGSGVGNDRLELSEESLGVPVVSVGVPTVIDAGFLGSEAKNLFVTPRDIDSRVRESARVIACAVNRAVHPQISLGEIEALIG